MDIEFNENRKYGIEIEAVLNGYSFRTVKNLLIEAGLNVYSEGYSHQTDGENYTDWVLKTDSSVNCGTDEDGNSTEGLELVSPVLIGRKGFQEIKKAISVLQQCCKVDTSCGFHVHHEVLDYKKYDFVKLHEFYKQFQKQINFLVSPSRRGNNYCKMLYGDVYQMKSGFSYDISSQWGRAVLDYYDRYHVVNFRSYAIRGTIEFRQHQGTLELKKIKSWVYLTQAIIERSKSGQIMKPLPNNKPYNRIGLLLRKLNFYDSESAERRMAGRYLKKRFYHFVERDKKRQKRRAS